MRILLTGGSGLLGKELRKYITCDAPSHKELDITSKKSIKKYSKNKYDLIIHAAAYTDLIKAETNRDECTKINVIGTKNLLKAFPNIPFVYISTEYCFNPVNFYSQTKLIAEKLVISSNRNLIIRTLFKPKPFPYKTAFFDQYTTGDYVDVIAPLIVARILADSWWETVHIGTGRKTMFELARRTKPNIFASSIDDVKDVKLPKDYEAK